VLRSNRYLPTPGGPDNSAALKKAPVSSLAQGPVKKKTVSANTASAQIKSGKRHAQWTKNQIKGKGF
jgi:hypothetical protein